MGIDVRYSDYGERSASKRDSVPHDRKFFRAEPLAGFGGQNRLWKARRCRQTGFQPNPAGVEGNPGLR